MRECNAASFQAGATIEHDLGKEVLMPARPPGAKSDPAMARFIFSCCLNRSIVLSNRLAVLDLEWRRKMGLPLKGKFDRVIPMIGVSPEYEPALEMFLASLYACAEGWPTIKVEDARVEELLADKARLKLLKDWRDVVFHFRCIRSPEAEAFKSDKGSVKWSRDLYTAFAKVDLQPK
jgi:hypothetical protein